MRQGVTDRERRRIEAAFYDLQERYDDKAQSLRVLVSLYPDDEEAHVELAGAYYDLGQLDQAILELREALRLNPFSAPAYGSLVLYLARDNRADAAIAAAREAEAAWRQARRECTGGWAWPISVGVTCPWPGKSSSASVTPQK